MTTTSSAPPPAAGSPVPRFSAVGVFLEGLAARDFDHLAAALSPDVHLCALLPRGLVEWDGAGAVKAAFTGWFGGEGRFDLVDAMVGEVGPRLHLRWRVRMRAARLGDGWFVVEQQAYADTDAAGRIGHLSLLCSGYCPERGDD